LDGETGSIVVESIETVNPFTKFAPSKSLEKERMFLIFAPRQE
jgi:hypothetical protein